MHHASRCSWQNARLISETAATNKFTWARCHVAGVRSTLRTAPRRLGCRPNGAGNCEDCRLPGPGPVLNFQRPAAKQAHFVRTCCLVVDVAPPAPCNPLPRFHQQLPGPLQGGAATSSLLHSPCISCTSFAVVPLSTSLKVPPGKDPAHLPWQELPLVPMQASSGLCQEV